MLSRDILSTQQSELASIAAELIALGARSFSVWSEGEPILAWPQGAPPCDSEIAAAIEVGGVVVGELRLAGLPAEQGSRRLRAEARLLARLLEVEADLEAMTAELLETQDQLLAMYDLTKAMRTRSSTADMLRGLAQETARLVKVQGAVLAFGPMMVQHPPDLIDERTLYPFTERARTAGDEILAARTEAGLPDGVANLCVLPIQIRGETRAALALVNRAGGFTAPDLKLARAIAEHAGAQIEHNLLHEDRLAQARLQAEMEVARKVQLQMLPHTQPRIPGLAIYAETRPALDVGGDFYDFVTEGGRQPLFVLGDVAGKGISAAMIMSMIRSSAHNSARFMPGASPASVVNRTNENLYDDLTMLAAFVTFFAAQYDAGARVMRCANAGHAPVIYRPPGGPATLLLGDGVPIGVLPGPLCEDQTLDFGPGAMLIVATDGLNEARDSADEMFGYERLLQLADEFADQPAQVIAYALYDAVAQHAGGAAQDDDQTLLIIKAAP